MTIWQFMDAHPYLTFFLILILCITVVDMVKAIRGHNGSGSDEENS